MLADKFYPLSVDDIYYFYIVLSSYTLNIILRIIKDDEAEETL